MAERRLRVACQKAAPHCVCMYQDCEPGAPAAKLADTLPSDADVICPTGRGWPSLLKIPPMKAMCAVSMYSSIVRRVMSCMMLQSVLLRYRPASKKI